MSLTFVIFVFIIVGLLFLYKDKIYGFAMFRYKVSKLPSLHRTAFPLIGHAHLLIGSPEKMFHNFLNLLREFEKTSKEKLVTMWLGTSLMVFVRTPYCAEVILKSSRHMQKALTYRCLHPWLGTGLLTSHGEKWKQRRRLITPSFHFSILQDFLDVMNEQSRTFVKSLKSKCDSSDSKSCDVGKAITMCALDIICETAMGQTVNAQEDYDSDYIKALYR